MEDKNRIKSLQYVSELILKRIKSIEKNLDDDFSSMEITGEYVHYKNHDSFEKAYAELLELKKGYQAIKETIDNETA